MRARRIGLIGVAIAVVLNGCAKEETTATTRVGESVATGQAADAGVGTLESRLMNGGKLYAAHCAACHQADGQGLTGAFPPLADSDYLVSGGPAAAIDVVLYGLSGPITVNGKDFNSVMPNLSYLGDDDVADILTFVFNSWGNPGGEVDSEQVAAARSKIPSPRTR